MKTYIKPEMEINELNLSETLLIVASAGGESLLGDGGTTSSFGSDDDIEAYSKQRGEGFDLLW